MCFTKQPFLFLPFNVAQKNSFPNNSGRRNNIYFSYQSWKPCVSSTLCELVLMLYQHNPPKPDNALSEKK